MGENKVKLLNNPYGQVNYEVLATGRQVFADKSGIIVSLEGENMPPYPVLLRPRQFGKTTFVQMLKCFYDISYADRYDEIFSGKDIYTKNLPSHNSFHVINFNFSGVSGDDKNTIIENFIIAIKRGITDLRGALCRFCFRTI